MFIQDWLQSVTGNYILRFYILHEWLSIFKDGNYSNCSGYNTIYPVYFEKFQNEYQTQFLQMMGSKLGLETTIQQDADLIESLQIVLQATETDMTIFFRNLGNFKKQTTIDDDGEFLEVIKTAFYKPEELKEEVSSAWKNWFVKYQSRLGSETRTDEARKVAMNKVNPKYVLRNFMAQIAIILPNSLIHKVKGALMIFYILKK